MHREDGISTPAARPRRFVRSQSDERLVELVRAGDAAAFEAIYDRYSRGLVSFCRHLLGSLEEAEDAVQHTFLAAHRAMLGDERELHLKAWLYAIARNKCISMLRVRRERLGFDDDELELVPSTAGLSAEVEQREDLRALLGDLARLPDDQRAALVLAEIGAHNHDEIAEVLDVRREKVKALVFQAREALIAARTARETPCHEIREQLATARGGALRRGNLRRHLDDCPGCRAFRMDVQHQRAALGVLLPVIPSLALKEAVLGGTATAAGVGAGGAAAGGIAAAGGAKAAAAKLMVVAAVSGGATGTGYVAVHKIDHGRSVPPAAVAASPAALPAQAAGKRVAVHLVKTPSTASTPLPVRRHKPARHVAKKHAHRARRHRAVQAAAPAPAAPTVAAAEPQPQTITPVPAHGRVGKPKKDKKPKKPKKIKRDTHAQTIAAPPSPPRERDDGDDGDDVDENDDQPKGDDDTPRPEGSDLWGRSHPRGGPPGQLKKRGEEPLPPPGQRKQDVGDLAGG